MSKPNVFVITPFGEDFLELYNRLSDIFSEKFIFKNAGDLESQQNILKDIVKGIENANVVIADLTGLNPNVFYELGLAHTMNKKVIIITQDLSELPFDIKSYRANEYSLQFNKIKKFEETLDYLLDAAINDELEFGNPVYDFSVSFKKTYLNNDKTNNETSCSQNNTKKNDEIIQENTPCIIDNIADIEDSIFEIIDINKVLIEEMNEMNTKITTATNEINKANKNKSNTTASYVRNIFRGLATPISEFSEKLYSKNNEMENKWNTIENNVLQLLTFYIQNPSKLNRKDFDNLMLGFDQYYSILCNNNIIMNGLNNATQTCKGFERRLNASLDKFIYAINYNINLFAKMQSSIDRINAMYISINNKED